MKFSHIFQLNIVLIQFLVEINSDKKNFIHVKKMKNLKTMFKNVSYAGEQKIFEKFEWCNCKSEEINQDLKNGEKATT